MIVKERTLIIPEKADRDIVQGIYIGEPVPANHALNGHGHIVKKGKDQLK